jgi:hypothetical protein
MALEVEGIVDGGMNAQNRYRQGASTPSLNSAGSEPASKVS